MFHVDCSMTFKVGFHFRNISFANHLHYIKVQGNNGELLGLHFIQKCSKFILNSHPYWKVIGNRQPVKFLNFFWRRTIIFFYRSVSDLH